MESPLQPAPEPISGDRLYRFVLPSFQGPLDLLLHLIRVNEVDITDLPVVEIARQYDAMLDLMHELNLEVAGEFLVMAATLVYIKSKLLLPADQERIAEGLEEDPRKNLVHALLEHQRFREAAAELAEREQQAALVFTRQAAADARDEEGYLEVSLFDLLGAFKRVLESADRRAALVRRREEIPLARRIAEIRRRLRLEGALEFERLLAESPGLDMMVVTFLAILELARMGALRVDQRRPFAPIRLRLAAA